MRGRTEIPVAKIAQAGDDNITLVHYRLHNRKSSDFNQSSIFHTKIVKTQAISLQNVPEHSSEVKMIKIIMVKIVRFAHRQDLHAGRVLRQEPQALGRGQHVQKKDVPLWNTSVFQPAVQNMPNSVQNSHKRLYIFHGKNGG